MSSAILRPSAVSLPTLEHVHTSKRGCKERTGAHAWHPYYAGYAEGFVTDILTTLALPTNLIFDPWNGSGTTTFVAQRAGYDTIGVEINPVMAIHAAAKDAHFVQIAKELLRDTENIIDAAHNDSAANTLVDALSEFVDAETLRVLRSLQKAIGIACPAPNRPTANTTTLLQPGEKNRYLYTKDRSAFFLSALFQVLRQFGSFKQGSNPTWLTRREGPTDHDESAILAAFRTTVSAMLQTLERATPAKTDMGQASVFPGDSRRLPLCDASVNLVITSPPYCTRIDYAMATKPELLLLDGSERGYDSVRRSTMGAPVIVDKTLIPLPTWGATCNEFLAAVPKHASKAARSYYLPNFLQYFRDAHDSLCEIARVLKPGGFAAIVVQSSYFKELEIRLGEIYVEMGQSVGLQAAIRRRETVRQHMAHINTKSRKYVDAKVYYEDVLLFSK